MRASESSCGAGQSQACIAEALRRENRALTLNTCSGEFGPGIRWPVRER